MTSPTLLSLAGRVESLTGPCRETDALIALAVGVAPEGAFRPCAAVDVGTFATGSHSFWTAPAYTASLDAAMTLRLDWMSSELTESAANDTLQEPRFTRCRIWDWRRGPLAINPDNEWKAEGNLPLPLNICAAILRARSALEASHG